MAEGTGVRFTDRFGAIDTVMWQVEADPALRSTIVAVGLLDAVPDRDRLRRQVERSVELIPRLRQSVVDPWWNRRLRWREVRHLDLDRHLRWRSAPDGDLLGVVDDVAATPFDPARPLWQHTVVEGLPEGRAALVMKVHHSLTDGVGGLAIAAGRLLALGPDDDGEDLPLPGAPAAPPGVGGELLRLLNPRTAGSVLRTIAPTHGALSPLFRVPRSIDLRHRVLTVDLDDFKRPARAAGRRVNDAFLAALAGGLARYHEKRGVPAEAVRVAMPIDLRGRDEGVVAGNRYLPSRIVLPLDVEDPVARMALVEELVRAERDEPVLDAAEPAAELLRHLPAPLRQAVFGGMLKGNDVVASNVLGPPIPLWMAGVPLAELWPFGPPVGAAVNVTMLSYCGRVHLGVTSDLAAVPDPDELLACLRVGVEEVAAL